MASCKKPVYKVDIKPIIDRKRRSSDLVVMWHSILDLSLHILAKFQVVFNHIWDTTKIWIKAEEQKEIRTWLVKHLPAVPEDFATSWRDGVLLSILLNKLQPGCFPNAENLDPNYSLRNVHRALYVLGTRFGIAPKITAEEIVTCFNGSDQKLHDLLLQLKQETEKKSKDETKTTEETNERIVESSLPTSDSNACTGKGTGLLVAFVGREANFAVFYKSYSELDLVVEIRGPTNELCSQRITKRSPKRKQSVRNWEPSPPNLVERSHSEKNCHSHIMGDDDKNSKDNSDLRKIPFKYEIRPNRVNFTYIPFSRGQYQVSVLHRGKHIKDSPYAVTVEPEPAGTNKKSDPCYKSALKKARQNAEVTVKKEAVRFNQVVPSETVDNSLFGRVVKRRVLRHVVQIDRREVVVSGAAGIDQLASALLKMDYELQKRPLVRRNSWGFVGDAERKVSAIRQFCVEVEDLEVQSLKMHRSLSLTIGRPPRKAKSGSYECEDVLCRGRLDTVAEGRFMHSHHQKRLNEEEEEASLVFLNEAFEVGIPSDARKASEENMLEASAAETPPLNVTEVEETDSSVLRVCEEKTLSELPQSESEICHPSDDPLLNPSVSPFTFPQNVDVFLENDLNVEGGNETIDSTKEKETTDILPKTESFQFDVEKPFTKTHVQNLGYSFDKKGKTPQTSSSTLEDNEETKISSRKDVQVFECFEENNHIANTKNSKKKVPNYLQKNLRSRQSYIPPCCVTKRQRGYNKTRKQRNNHKNCAITPLNVVYLPVYRDCSYKCPSINQEVKIEKQFNGVADEKNQMKASNYFTSGFEHNFSNRCRYDFKSPKISYTDIPNDRADMNCFQTNPYSNNIHVPKNVSQLSTEPSKRFQSNLNNPKENISERGLEKSSSFPWPNQRRNIEQNRASSSVSSSSNVKESDRNIPIKKHFLVSLGQFHYKHFNPVVENKTEGPVKLRVKQWQRKASENPQNVKKDVQKFDTLPEKGNLTAKLQFWENVQKKSEGSSNLNSLDTQRRENANDKKRCDEDGESEKSISFLLNISGNDTAENPERSETTYAQLKENLRSLNSDDRDLEGKPTHKLVTPITRIRKRSFSDPGNLEISRPTHGSEVSDQAEIVPEPIRGDILSSSSDANYLELSADDEISSSADLPLYSTEDEYIDDEISDSASTYWGDLSLIKDLKVADSSAYRDLCSLVDARYWRDRKDSLDSCQLECQVYGIANYFGHVAVKNRFRVLTNGTGFGNLSATVQGLGHHEVSFVSVEYVQRDVYEVTYQVLTPGLYLISVRWMESPISGSPFLCKVTF